MGYAVGIDLGTTWSAAAVVRSGSAEVASLGTHGAAIPSVVFLRDDGEVLVGEAAERRAAAEPSRVARDFKRRLGDPVPVLLGGAPIGAEALMGHLLASLVARVVALEGGDPDHAVITHPANWGPYKLDLLRETIRTSGLDRRCPTTLLSEPEAAAAHYAATERVPTGASVAVYDLGGGTFDATVLRKTDDGYDVLGVPEGIERLGGIDFDAAVLGHVDVATGGALSALDPSDPHDVAVAAELKRRCVEAKEALSADTDAVIPVALADRRTEVRITRGELEAMLRPSLNESVAVLRRTIEGAGLTPSALHAVLLVGGSSRIPLVGELVGSLGAPVAVDAHPKHAVALGAARTAAERAEAARSEGLDDAGSTPSAAAVVPTPAVLVGVAPGLSSGGRRRSPLLLSAAAVVVVAVVAAVLLLGGGGDPRDEVGSGAGSPSGSDDGTAAPATTGAAADPTPAVLAELPEGEAGTIVFRQPADDEAGVPARLLRIVAEEGAAVEDVSAALDALSPLPPGGTDVSISTSRDGSVLLVHTNRFGCDDPSCLVLLPRDLSSAERIELFLEGNDVYPEGTAAVDDSGTTVVYIAADGPHDRDLWVVRKEGTLWGAPVLLSGASTFEFNDAPVLSPDGTLVAFTCGPIQYFDQGAGVCVVNIDGTGFRQAVAPHAHPNAVDTATVVHGSFTPDGSALVFEAAWPNRALFRQELAEGSQPERIDVEADEDYSPCVLPSGRIASRWYEPDASFPVLKVMEADGSAAAVIYRDTPIEAPFSCGA